MLSKADALDIPDLGSDTLQQQRIAALGISINQFNKTLQGKSLIEEQKLFILGGILYQGYNQKAVECPEDQCSDREIDGAHDVDGSKQRILDTRRRRLEGAANAKATELRERRKLKIAQERDELELKMLKRRMAKEDAEDGVQQDPEIEPDPEPNVVHACPADGCGKVFDSARKLNAHKMGAKH